MKTLNRGPPATRRYYVKYQKGKRLMELVFTTFFYITTYLAKYTLWKAFHKTYIGK